MNSNTTMLQSFCGVFSHLYAFVPGYLGFVPGLDIHRDLSIAGGPLSLRTFLRLFSPGVRVLGGV